MVARDCGLRGVTMTANTSPGVGKQREKKAHEEQVQLSRAHHNRARIQPSMHCTHFSVNKSVLQCIRLSVNESEMQATSARGNTSPGVGKQSGKEAHEEQVQLSRVHRSRARIQLGVPVTAHQKQVLVREQQRPVYAAFDICHLRHHQLPGIVLWLHWRSPAGGLGLVVDPHVALDTFCVVKGALFPAAWRGGALLGL